MHIKGPMSMTGIQSNFGIDQILLLHSKELNSDQINFHFGREHQKTVKMSDDRWHGYYLCKGCNFRYEAILIVFNSSIHCDRCKLPNSPYQQVILKIKPANIFQSFNLNFF